jgi:hypothetical protein
MQKQHLQNPQSNRKNHMTCPEQNTDEIHPVRRTMQKTPGSKSMNIFSENKIFPDSKKNNMPQKRTQEKFQNARFCHSTQNQFREILLTEKKIQQKWRHKKRLQEYDISDFFSNIP